MQNKEWEESVTYDDIYELLYVDDFGAVRRKTQTSPRIKVNDIFGHRHTRKGLTYMYGKLTVCGKKTRLVYAHRVAYLLHTGHWPTGCIDHINGDGTDNRLCNIRDVSQRSNTKNTKLRMDNTSGVVGVSWSTRDRHWRVQISDNNGSRKFIVRNDFFEAVCVRRSAELHFGYHKNHGLALSHRK